MCYKQILYLKNVKTTLTIDLLYDSEIAKQFQKSFWHGNISMQNATSSPRNFKLMIRKYRV